MLWTKTMVNAGILKKVVQGVEKPWAVDVAVCDPLYQEMELISTIQDTLKSETLVDGII